MVLSTHVDDLKGASTRADAEALLKFLEEKFGNCSQEWKEFTHTGIEHVQTPRGVYVHQFKYADQLVPIPVGEIKGKPDEELAEGDFPSKYMSLLGGLAWLVLTRVDLAVYVQALQRRAHAPRVVDFKRLNTVVRYARRKKVGIFYGPLDKSKLCVTVFSDAAFKAVPEESHGLALRGCVILLAEANPDQLLSPEGKCHMLEYVCRRQRRVVRSTYSAELNGLIDSVEITLLMQFLLHQIFYGTDQSASQLARAQESGQLQPPVNAATDAKAVFDSVAAPDVCEPAECSLKLHLISIRDKVSYGTIKNLFWSDTRDMLADGLTKGSVNRLALQTVAEHGKHVLTKEVQRYTAPTGGSERPFRSEGGNVTSPSRSDPPEID